MLTTLAVLLLAHSAAAATNAGRGDTLFRNLDPVIRAPPTPGSPLLQPQCKANEELCPVARGSDELHVSSRGHSHRFTRLHRFVTSLAVSADDEHWRNHR